MLLGHPSIRGGVRRYSRSQDVVSLVTKLLNTELKGFGMARRRLLAIEGPDFVGKGSITDYLANNANSLFGLDCVLVSDPPWKLPPWEQLSGIFRTDNRLSGPAEALLYCAARVDNYHRCIQPALKKGKVVVCDRYIDSWLAYQSVRLINSGEQRAMELLLTQQTILESFNQIEPPGLTILLMADIEELKRRSEVRPNRDKYEEWSYLEQVIEAYEELHSRFPYRFVRCETTGRDENKVRDFVTDVVREYLEASSVESF